MSGMRGFFLRLSRFAKRLLVISAISGSIFVWFPLRAIHAAPLKGFEAMLVSMSGSGLISLKPGERKEITVEFQNIGTKIWNRKGTGYVSVYTYEPKYRSSVFWNDGWFKKIQPAVLTEESVSPKGIGHVKFFLKAPTKEGTYKETFHLASEDTAWIPGGVFSLNIVVSKSAAVVKPASATSGDTRGLAATLMIRSQKHVQAVGGAEVSFTVGIKNAGTARWMSRDIRVASDVTSPVVSNGTYHDSWESFTTVATDMVGTIEPGGMNLLSFSFTAPKQKGAYTVRYQFAANDTVVPDFFIDIPVEVTSDAATLLSESPIGFEEITESLNIIDEPMIRVGILLVDEETDWQVVVSCASNWRLFDTQGALLGEIPANNSVSAFYKKGKYWFNRGSGLESNTYPIRFVPNEKNAVCTITNFDRRLTRGVAYADNSFRNILELRYNATKDRTWVINELPMEMYLRGLAETSNLTAMEYQKAQVTAARTYGFYHVERASKHASEFFHVDAYRDQVYKGFGSEGRMPKLVDAVEATRGVIAFYGDKVAITPYYSQSDGRTRSWNEVWYGNVAWLQSVPAPCDAGKALLGHGVGMSASEGICQARAGKAWKDILNYFYTGVDLRKHWN